MNKILIVFGTRPELIKLAPIIHEFQSRNLRDHIFIIHTALPNLHLIPPVSFQEMMNLYKKTSLIITDSGGIQEEAAYLGIPALIYRTKTERIEGICKGIAKYMDEAGHDLDLLTSELNRNKPPGFNLIYGDGYASKRIVDFLLNTYMTPYNHP